MPIIEIEEDEHQEFREEIVSYPGKKLVIDDINELVIVCFTNLSHYENISQWIEIVLDNPVSYHYEMFETIDDKQNLSIVFTTNTRRSLKFLEEHAVFSRKTFEKALTELNSDPDHIIRYIKKLKTWSSPRIEFSHFKNLTFEHIKLIIYYVNRRKRDFKYLELNDNGIDDDLAIYLTKNLKYIFKLYLENNNISDKACVPIIECGKFITLSFRNNPEIKNENNRVYDAALKNKTCTNLKLKGTGLSNQLLENIYDHCHSIKHRREHISSYTHLSSFDHDFDRSTKNTVKVVADEKKVDTLPKTDLPPVRHSRISFFTRLANQASASSSEANADTKRCCIQ